MNNPAPSPMRLHLLHSPRLIHAQERVLPLADKDAALLALVVLDGPASRARVAGLLWPGDGSPASERKALNNLRQRLFRLGKWAGREVVVQGNGHGNGLALAPGIVHDVHIDAGTLLQDPDAAAGDLLGSHAYAGQGELALWVDAARQRWRAQRADILIGSTVRLESEGRLGEAVRLALRLVGDEPMMEHACRILMRLHHRRGDRGAALAEYERCRRVLYEQEGEVPSQETIELSLAIGRDDLPSAPRAPALPLTLRHPPRTVGRSPDMARADHAWHHGGVVLLSGAAGIGKSRLMADLLLRWQVDLHLCCRPDAQASSFGLLSMLAQALAPRVRSRLDTDSSAWLDWLAAPRARPAPSQPVQQGKLVDVLKKALAAAGAAGAAGAAAGANAGMALAIEDLHHADAASVDVLCSLLPRAGAAPPHDDGGTRWLLSARDTELPPAVQAWLDRQPAGLTPVVTLAPLDAAAASDLLLSLGVAPDHPHAAGRLHSHCGGHPLFMLQVLRQLQLASQLDHGAWPDHLPLPDEAMASASQRLTRAEPLAQQMAYLAALCGPDFTPALLCRLMGLTAAQLLAPWRRLEDLHIFGPRGFAHDLVREAVLGVVPQALSPLLHRDIALALEQEAGDPLRRALHWQAAGDIGRAAADLQRAATVARHCGLMPQAIDHLRAAGRLWRQAGRGGAGFECDCEAASLMLAYTSAQGALALAQALMAEAGAATSLTPTSSREQALVGELMANVKNELHDASALAQAQAALAMAHRAGDDALALRCRIRVGAALCQAGEHARGLAEFDAVALQADRLDTDLRYTLASDRASALASLGRREEALAVHQAYLQQALAERCHTQASFSAGFCATHLGYLCRVSESLELAEQSVALARLAGVEHGLVLVDEMGLAGNLGDLGRFTEALARGESVLAELQRSGLHSWAVNAANDRATLYMRLGRPDLARHLLLQPMDAAPAWVRAGREVARARLDAWQGHPWRDGIDQALTLLGEAGGRPDVYPWPKIALEAARARGPAAAAEVAAATATWAQRHQHVALERFARVVEIDALRQLGHHADAGERALRLLPEPGLTREAFGFYLPDTLLQLSDALWAAGLQTEGDGLATEAAMWVDDRARHHVPAVFATPFRTQNPINARLLRWLSGRAVAARQ